MFSPLVPLSLPENEKTGEKRGWALSGLHLGSGAGRGRRAGPGVLGVLHELLGLHLVLVILVAVPGGEGGWRGVLLLHPNHLLPDHLLLIGQKKSLRFIILKLKDNRWLHSLENQYQVL